MSGFKLKKKDLVDQLKYLNHIMVKTADMIEKLYPESNNLIQLKGAAGKIFEWATDIQEEIKEKK